MAQFNKDRLAQVLAVIEANPESHNQDVWHAKATEPHPCGTVHCLFGHAQLLLPGATRRSMRDLTQSTINDAKQVLGITSNGVASWFSSSQRTLEDFRRVLAAGRVVDETGTDVFYPWTRAT